MENTFYYNLNNKEFLREVTVKIGLERIDIQEGVTGLVINSEFVKKQEFKLKKIENLIYVRNVDGTFNKERLIENIVEVNIYYQGHRKRTEIDMIRGQKQNIILEILWLVCYNPEIDQRISDMQSLDASFFI